jgi:hypothetical protein
MIHRRDIALGLAAALAAPAYARTPFRPLFDGRSLEGWTRVGEGNWTVEDGAICADKGGFSFLVSKDDYRDFDLLAEIWASPDANSGIFIRCTDREKITAANAYEVNIFDTRPDPAYGTGAIVDVAKVSPMPKAGGRWSTLEISARGDTFSVAFNGQKTVEGARDARFANGPIALQYGAGAMKFRRVEIRAI